MEVISNHWEFARKSLEVVGNGVASRAVPSALTELVRYLSGVAGVTTPEVRIFLCLLLAYPFGVMWRQIPGAKAKHLFSIVVGSWTLMFTFGSQWIHVHLSSLLCYSIMLIGGPKSRHITAAVAMLYLSCMHLYRQITDYLGWTIDVTFSQMIVTQKLHALAYNYYDGSAKAATDEQKALSTDKLPSLLEFYSFILFPSGVIMGPTIEFDDYRTFANDEIDIPSPYLASLSKFAQSLVYLVLNTIANTYLPCGELLRDPKFLSSGNILSRFALQWLSLLGYRLKYYFGWKISEGAIILSGIGYNGFDKVSGTHKWDRVDAMDVFGFEFAQSLRGAQSAWNQTTNRWLRKYAYDRVPAPFNLYYAYLVSAIWHGFYPGYYLFFMTAAFCTAVHRKIRRNVRPWFMAEDGKAPGPYKGLYDVLSVIVTSCTMEYLISSFILLSWHDAIAVFKSQYFIGHIIAVTLYAIFSMGLIRPPKRKLEAKTQ